MSTASHWRDVKAKARAIDPASDTAERVARRARMREELVIDQARAPADRLMLIIHSGQTNDDAAF